MSSSPAAAVVEEVAARWLLDLLGLPAAASVGFVTGGRWPTSPASRPRGTRSSRAPAGTSRTAASLARRRSRFFVGEERTSTIYAALRMLGLGREPRHVASPTDEQGRMRPDALRDDRCRV